MEGCNVVITGGSNGMGKASALRVAESGANVAICDLNKDAGAQVLQELSSKYPKQKFVFKAVDVTDIKAVENVFEEIAQELGSVTNLVCSAGIAIPSPRLHEANLQHFQKIIEVNLHGTTWFNTVFLRHVLKHKESGAKAPAAGYTIVNLGSKGSVEGLPGASAYTASKHGVLGLTKVVAKDYAADGVRCNCLCPGLIWTDMMKQLNASGKEELSEAYLLRQCYTRRYGTVEEMANIVHFLLSGQSSYITGQAIEADGMWAI